MPGEAGLPGDDLRGCGGKGPPCWGRCLKWWEQQVKSPCGQNKLTESTSRHERRQVAEVIMQMRLDRSDQQVQRPWGRGLLEGSGNMVKASVAGVEVGRGGDGGVNRKRSVPFSSPLTFYSVPSGQERD